VRDLHLFSIKQGLLHEDQRSLKLSFASPRWPRHLTAWFWQVSDGLLATRMAELSSSVDGSESATGSCTGDSRPPLAMVRRYFSLCCAFSVF
jgi:hypothetical protein